MAEAPPRWIGALPVRVYYEDTDAGGVVYHANYLRFAERARSELLRRLGFDHARLRRDFGIGFTVRRCAVEFERAARLDDLLTVRTALEHLGGARAEVVQAIACRRRPVATIRLTLALVDTTMRAMRFPLPLRAALRDAPPAPAADWE